MNLITLELLNEEIKHNVVCDHALVNFDKQEVMDKKCVIERGK